MTPVERRLEDETPKHEFVRIAEALERIAVLLDIWTAPKPYASPPVGTALPMNGYVCPRCGTWTQLGTHVCYTAPHTVYGGDPW